MEIIFFVTKRSSLLSPISVKSFYSLDYTCQDFSDIDELGALIQIQGSGPPKDYSAIIDELESHRRAIEKLQNELASSGGCRTTKQGSHLSTAGVDTEKLFYSNKRTLTVGGRITAHLVPCFTRLELTKCLYRTSPWSPVLQDWIWPEEKKCRYF